MSGEFSHGLFSCFDDCMLCLTTWIVPCYTHGKSAEAVGDDCLLCGLALLVPLLDLYAVCSNRGKIREQKGIAGSCNRKHNENSFMGGVLMGGAVSHGVDNNDLVDKLWGAGYIRSPDLAFVLRAVDRAMYFPKGNENLAYRDLAYKNGDFHLSAPCIYCEVLEGLELKEGLSFLNIGSGTGYLSTVVGLLLGGSGSNHGVEICNNLVKFAQDRMQTFLEKAMPNIFGVEFCEPVFVVGNGLCLEPYRQYDRVYCGATVSPQYEDYIKSLVKIGGILIMPFDDKLLKIIKVSERDYEESTLLAVSFAPMLQPGKEEKIQSIEIASNPRTLQSQCRTVVRCLLGAKNLKDVKKLNLPLPKPMLQYLLYQ